MKTKQQLFEDKVRRIVKEELMKEEREEFTIEQVAKNLKKQKFQIYMVILNLMILYCF